MSYYTLVNDYIINEISSNTIKSVFIRYNKDIDFIKLYNALKNNTSITELSFINIIINEDFYEYIIKALYDNKTLTKLSLLYTIDNRNLSRYLSDLFEHNKTITYLSLMDIGLYDNELFENIITNNTSLTNLDMNVINPLHVNVTEQICKILKYNTTLTQLDISRNGINLENLTEALQINTSIINLSIGATYNISCLDTILSKNNTIVELYLDYIQINNSFEMEKLAEIIKDNDTLHILSLQSIEMDDFDKNMYKYLLNSLAQNTSITYLNLSDNLICMDELSYLLTNNKTINTLYLCQILSFDEDESENIINNLIEPLKVNTTITKLNLSLNKLYKVTEDLAEMLKINSTITDLDLYNNSIKEKIKYITDALEVNTTLSILNLSYNKINDNIDYITHLLEVNTTLTNLNLEKNFKLKNYDKLINALINNTNLVEVSLFENTINPLDILKIIQKNSTLTKLDCSDIITTDSLDIIKDALMYNTTLTDIGRIDNLFSMVRDDDDSEENEDFSEGNEDFSEGYDEFDGEN